MPEETTITPGASGGPISAAQAAAPQTNTNQQIAMNPQVDEADLTATLPAADYSKDKDLSLESFRDATTRPYQIPKPQSIEAGAKPDEQSNEAGEEGETQAEGEVQQGEVQSEGDGEGEQTEVIPSTEPTGQSAQPQRSVDPLVSAFPEINIFGKKMDKSAREWVTARLRENLEVKKKLTETEQTLAQAQQGITKIPDSYYENQHAFILTPEWQRASVDNELARAVANHWNQQAVNVMNGKNWQPCEIKQDSRTGAYHLIKGAEQKYSEEGMAQVMREKDYAVLQASQMSKELETVQSNFTQTVTQRMARIQQATTELFPKEVWEAKDTEQAKTVAEVRDGLKNIGISPSNPAYELLSRAGAALILTRKALAAAQKKQGTQQAVQKDIRRAGPTGNATVSGGGKQSGAGGDVTVDDFRSKLPQSRY